MSRQKKYSSHNMSRSTVDDRHKARVEWLRTHPDRWIGLPSDTEDVTEQQSELLNALGQELQEAGLVGKSAWPSIRMMLRKAIGALKREAVSA